MPDPEQISSTDKYLAAIAGYGAGELPEPISRTEQWLKLIYENGGGGGGGSSSRGDMESSVYDPQGKAQDIFAAISGKQDKLTGKKGQIVGFDDDGNAKAQEPPFGLTGYSIDWDGTSDYPPFPVGDGSSNFHFVSSDIPDFYEITNAKAKLNTNVGPVQIDLIPSRNTPGLGKNVMALKASGYGDMYPAFILESNEYFPAGLYIVDLAEAGSLLGVTINDVTISFDAIKQINPLYMPGVLKITRYTGTMINETTGEFDRDVDDSSDMIVLTLNWKGYEIQAVLNAKQAATDGSGYWFGGTVSLKGGEIISIATGDHKTQFSIYPV